MPLTDYNGAQAVVSRVHRKVKNFMYENKWGISCSIGVVTFTELPATIDEMINLADAQMYIAKRNGKNAIKHVIFDKSTANNIQFNKI